MYQGFNSYIMIKLLQSTLSFCVPTHLVSVLGWRSLILWYNTLRHMDQPHEIHFRAVTRILNFVQGTRTHGIHYFAQFSLELVGFIDFDWVGDSIDRKSTSGYVFIPEYGPISWSSKNQSSIALSFIEVEYRRVVNVAT